MTTQNAVGNGLSGATGTGSFVGSASPTLTGTLTTPSVTFNSTSGIIGTTTNNNAAAGSVGELISSVISATGSVPFNTITPTNLTSISLTAGDYDIWGNESVTFSISGNQAFGWISTTSATVPDTSLYNGAYLITGALGVFAFQVPQIRLSLASTTTVYISIYGQFASGTAEVCGGIYARRVR
jgi:hypothetical protein